MHLVTYALSLQTTCANYVMYTDQNKIINVHVSDQVVGEIEEIMFPFTVYIL